MSDLSNLSNVQGSDLTETQIQGIIAQIDLDITNLLREGKLSALKYSFNGPGGRSMDRAANLQALLEARKQYQQLLAALPSWEVSQHDQDEFGTGA